MKLKGSLHHSLDVRKVTVASPEVYSYGAMLIGGILRERGYGVKVVRGWEGLEGEVVGLSLTSLSHLREAARLVPALKKGGKKVVIGGPITQVPELVLRSLPEVDAVVVGEGEETAPEVFGVLLERGELEGVEGVAFLREGEEVKTPPRRPPDLSGRPLPEIPSDVWRQDIRGAQVYLETHRGCLGGCGFCQVPCFFGRRVRSRPPEEIEKEVKAFMEKGVRRISFFGGTSTHYGRDGEGDFIDLLERVSKLLGPKNVSVPDLRVDEVDREVLEALKRYTIGFLIFGIESGSTRMLRKMRKGITVEQIWEGVEKAREVGLEVGGAFIVGYPGETEEDYLETKEMVEELMLDEYTISLADPLPGTPLAEEVCRLPEEENPVFQKEEGKWGRLGLTVAEARALDLMLTASCARSRPILLTDGFYHRLVEEVKKQGEEVRANTRDLKRLLGFSGTVFREKS
ncbi:MAG: methyl-coenzyme M reductase glutamine C-methyltransferase, partial [Candidatus Hadarchaeales archaeon]